MLPSVDAAFDDADIDSLIQQFDRMGYAVSRGLLGSAAVHALHAIHREGVLRWRRGEGPRPWLDDPTAVDCSESGIVLRRVARPFDWSSSFREIFGSRTILRRVAALIGPRIYLHSSKMIFKPAWTGRAKPPHQDLAYWPDQEDAQVTLWAAADEMSATNGGMWLIPGSHRGGLRTHTDLGDWRIPADALPAEDGVFVPMAAGDVLFLDVRTVHWTNENCTGQGRLAAIVNYRSAPRRQGDASPYGTTEPLAVVAHDVPSSRGH